jgi:hypothetical protein
VAKIMGATFKLVEQHLLSIEQDSIFVEIGSDRYEGSTEFFAELAIKNNTVLHTVDISNKAQQRLTRNRDIPEVIWHQAIGSDWAAHTFPSLDKKIALLYLDNFDYDWEISRHTQNIELQKKDYLETFSIDMTNENCQIEHLKQMLALYPYMSNHSIVVCDDTYQFNDCWIGKCGPVVVYLLANGYKIITKEAGGDAGYNYGVILAR